MQKIKTLMASFQGDQKPIILILNSPYSFQRYTALSFMYPYGALTTDRQIDKGDYNTPTQCQASKMGICTVLKP